MSFTLQIGDRLPEFRLPATDGKDLVRHGEVFRDLDEWAEEFAAFVREKGKGEPGKYRAFGY